MSWPGNPKTFTAVVVTVSDLNTEIRDRFIVVKTNLDDDGFPLAPFTGQKTADYTITTADSTIECFGTFTVTLPTAVGCNGREYTVKNSSTTGVITMATTAPLGGGSSELIDAGPAGNTKLYGGDSLTFRSNGTHWWIV